ncbi:hypothetical protein BOTBODRAFT_61359 [Botryobasidium botryosum FD-172 SS1]|uniref:t-SNARE coiled-coil homology domain-containing protein n=1 Tax=Botryobasidium botryosum (strain FD-172 SS1) TaxID=930990 RepID=A0A067N151_BOTB1|nr:hypothetical protein BOTBODRAFT_61359 [Botryobasidium botryosum FD-172 SS1]
MAALNPTTRSRTSLFLSYRDSTGSTRSRRLRSVRRDSYHNDNDYLEGDERQGLIASGDSGHAALEMQDLPPRWVDLSEQVQEILAGTVEKIRILDKLHAKHVLPGFSDRSTEEKEIEMMTTDITRSFRQCQSLIQRIEPSSSAPHTFPPSTSRPSQNETQAARNVQRGLAAKVQELSGVFRKKQSVYMQKLQGHAIKNQDLLIASGAVSLKGSDGMFSLEEDIETSRTQLSAQQQLPPDLERRNHELTEIAKSIASLAELFKDLSSLVIDQGTILDSVEYNVERTAIHVEEAAKELRVATEYQRNTGRRKCILLLILIIFGLVVLLIFKPRRRASPPIESPPSG